MPMSKPGMMRPPMAPKVDVPTMYSGKPVCMPKRPGTRKNRKWQMRAPITMPASVAPNVPGESPFLEIGSQKANQRKTPA